MKWALVLVYMSGFWDSGLRYDTHEKCMRDGVRASYFHIHGERDGSILYDVHPPVREQYKTVVKCFPSN